MSRNEIAKSIAVVPQNATLPLAFTVLESVSLGRTPHLNWLGQLSKEDIARIEWAMNITELTLLKQRRIGQLSGGEQQRALLARALVQDATILLLDEPTAHLDLHHQVSFLDLLSHLAESEHLAVLIALHDLNLASVYATRLILLAAGQVEAAGSVQDVLTTEILQRVYRAPLRVQKATKGKSPIILIDR